MYLLKFLHYLLSESLRITSSVPEIYNRATFDQQKELLTVVHGGMS